MKTLLLSEENQILTISLNRPRVHNAFDPETILEITQIFTNEKKVTKYRAIILKGEGDSFCAGADLNWMKSMIKFNYEENLQDAQKLYTMFDVLKNCPIPLIGRIHGNVFGGGVGLVAACDIVAAESKTKFCFSEAKLGLIPSVISPLIKRKMTPALMRELFLTAEVFDVEKAKESRLIHFYGSTKDCEKFISTKIESIRKCGKVAIIETKKLLNELEVLDPSEYKKETTTLISKRRISEEGQEGLKAFLEKRKPNWIS